MKAVKNFLQSYRDKIKNCTSYIQACECLDKQDLIYSVHVIKEKFNCSDSEIINNFK